MKIQQRIQQSVKNHLKHKAIKWGIIIAVIVGTLGLLGMVCLYVGNFMQAPAIIQRILDAEIEDAKKSKEESGCQCGCVWVTDTADETGYDFSTGTLTGDSIPEFSGNRQRVVNEVLPAAIAAEEYYQVRAVFTLCHVPKEAGWNRTGDTLKLHGYNLFGISGTNKVSGESHTYQHGSTKFRSYSCIEESVVDHGALLKTDDRYKNVSEAYNMGWKEQAKELAYTPYLGVSGTPEQILSARENYSNVLISFANEGKEGSFTPFEDLDMARKYINKNGLEQSYNKALEIMKTNAYYKDLMSASKSNGGTVSIATGHWECDCASPCPYCSCHDNDIYDSDGNVIGKGTQSVDGEYFWPTYGDVNGNYITSFIGDRNVSIGSNNHAGIDIGVNKQPVMVMADGVIGVEAYNVKRGYYVLVEHGNSFASIYQHLSAPQTLVGVNSNVTKGQVIGLSGNTGDSSGPHLHFEVAFMKDGDEWDKFIQKFKSKDNTLQMYTDPLMLKYENMKNSELTFSNGLSDNRIQQYKAFNSTTSEEEE